MREGGREGREGGKDREKEGGKERRREGLTRIVSYPSHPHFTHEAVHLSQAPPTPGRENTRTEPRSLPSSSLPAGVRMKWRPAWSGEGAQRP